MCGIFGVNIGNTAAHSEAQLKALVNDLFLMSESRGKEASGLAVTTKGSIVVIKGAIPAKSFIQTPKYKNLIRDSVLSVRPDNAFISYLSLIGHSRLVTNGSMMVHENNQPVISSGVVGVHNGIIVNDDMLWKEHPTLQRKYEVDTEVIFSLVRHYFEQSGSIGCSLYETFKVIQGTASIALSFADMHNTVIATNNGSLYYAEIRSQHLLIFASEEHIVSKILERHFSVASLKDVAVHQVLPWNALCVDNESVQVRTIALRTENQSVLPISSERREKTIVDASLLSSPRTSQLPWIVHNNFSNEIKRFDINTDKIERLRRCTLCVLPETVPFIEFDEHGVCNFCRHYHPVQTIGEQALHRIADRIRRSDNRPDCLVTFSGGRDSCYGLHYVKKVLRLNPVAYSYDWGMITDLGRRNQARLCGTLGVEHLLVSADIRKKRRFIKQNVEAWLRRPDLGTVPLFMAGDKQYFYYANKLRKQIGVDQVVLCENSLERTNFKTGFCGVFQPLDTQSIYGLSVKNQLKLAFYYAKQYARNRYYLNASLIDTLGAFASYYLIPHEFLNVYQFVRWDEKVIVSTLRDEYDWEVATDTKSTWRIGDGTAPFYNYIYYCIAGFTENDTFRSNQVREGMLTRSEALEQIYIDNAPRYDSIRWYCDTIGVDMLSALAKINSVPKLYERL